MYRLNALGCGIYSLEKAGMLLVAHLQTGQRWVPAVELEESPALEAPAGVPIAK